MYCNICGKYSGKYPLCKECYYKENENEYEYVDEEITGQCLICENDAGEYLFCPNCYRKYRNKTIYLEITNCDEIKLLDAEYKSGFMCEDGHKVKSPYEKIIDNWLYQEGILHAYEKKIIVDKNNDLTPDFYIPKLTNVTGKTITDIYIEFWGYDETNIHYQEIKNYKTNLYPQLCRRDGITIIYLNKEEVENDTYKKKIKFAEQGKINP